MSVLSFDKDARWVTVHWLGFSGRFLQTEGWMIFTDSPSYCRSSASPITLFLGGLLDPSTWEGHFELEGELGLSH